MPLKGIPSSQSLPPCLFILVAMSEQPALQHNDCHTSHDALSCLGHSPKTTKPSDQGLPSLKEGHRHPSSFKLYCLGTFVTAKRNGQHTVKYIRWLNEIGTIEVC